MTATGGGRRPAKPAQTTLPLPAAPAAPTPPGGPARPVRPGDRMNTPRVLGLDLSLTGTGIAVTSPDGIAITTVRTKNYGPALTEQWQRLLYIDARIHQAVDDAPDLVVIEGPSYGSAGSGTWDRAGLWWHVVNGLLAEDVPVAIVPPALVKKYATGKGGGKDATKAAVCSAAGKRYGRVFATDDEADAFVLLAMGLDHLGCPVVEVPKTHRAALDAVAWPEVTA